MSSIATSRSNCRSLQNFGRASCWSLQGQQDVGWTSEQMTSASYNHHISEMQSNMTNPGMKSRACASHDTERACITFEQALAQGAAHPHDAINAVKCASGQTEGVLRS